MVIVMPSYEYGIDLKVVVGENEHPEYIVKEMFPGEYCEPVRVYHLGEDLYDVVVLCIDSTDLANLNEEASELSSWLRDYLVDPRIAGWELLYVRMLSPW